MLESQVHFITRLSVFISEVEAMPRFAGQTQALRALRRIKGMAVFNAPHSPNHSD
jgi:hypothetical protein